MIRQTKKLIEVALPLDAINVASALEKGNPFLKGHPRNLHQWWARRPHAAARAVIFSQMVDDPSSYPDLFPTEKAQRKERERLFRIIESLVKWENSTNEEVLQAARDEIWASWRRACALNAGHPRAKELFDRDQLPAFHDPFAGGGAIPLEAQRLGLTAYASDLNPVAVLINKAMVEIPARFSGRSPVNSESRAHEGPLGRVWEGAQGLAQDVRHYSIWMRNEAERRIGHLYPKLFVTAEIVGQRPDLSPYNGQEISVIAWIWARTVKSPNPAFAHVDVPLISSFVLSTKAGKESYIEPIIEGDTYRFSVRLGKPPESARYGTTAGKRSAFICLVSKSPISYEYIRSEGKARRMGSRLMAIVAEGQRGRIYLAPEISHVHAAEAARPTWGPELDLSGNTRNFNTPVYGLSTFADLFTPRQLVALTTYSDLVPEVRQLAQRDAMVAGMTGDDKPLRDGGCGALAYGEAIEVYQALILDKVADYNNTICTWNPTNQNIGHLFSKQAIPMTWDYPEASPLVGGLSFEALADGVARSIAELPSTPPGTAFQHDCVAELAVPLTAVVSTDPPYFDNIGYAELSDFFYPWIRRSIRSIWPEIFATLSVPKSQELIASPIRHGGRAEAEAFFLDGMTAAMRRIAGESMPGFPITIYYAFKQAEQNANGGASSTGWETFLDAVLDAGLSVAGTWPIRTERSARAVGLGTNALASSIVLVCRPRNAEAHIATRREFVDELARELPAAVRHLQAGNIAPVDLAQAAIGPGMAVFTKYARVLDADGSPLSVRDALALINVTLDEVLAEQESDFDADSRWALAWFEQYGFEGAQYGVAEQLSKAKNTSVAGMVQAGILESKGGKVRLKRASELAADWDPETDTRLSEWEAVHHLIRVLESGGESVAAKIAAKLGSRAEPARELAYRLYSICERKKRATEALAYNGLVQSWPEIMRLARAPKAESDSPGLFDTTP